MSQNGNQNQKKRVNNEYSVLYKKYTDLKFLNLDDANLSDKQLKELKGLEEEVKKYVGKTSKHTKTAAIGAENLKLVKGIVVPNEYVEIIKAHKKGDVLDYYLA